MREENRNILFHPKVMSARFHVNSHSIWNEVAEKLFVSFSIFLSFCLLDLYTLHYLSFYSECMQWRLPWKSAVSASSSCLPFQTLSSKSIIRGSYEMSGMAAHCICSGSSEFCSWHGLSGNSGWNQVANYDSLCCLTFDKWPGEHCSMKCTSLLSDREKIFLQWALKLNSALATKETWDLKGCMLKVSVNILGY
jgi:hypothetical protein